MFKYKVPILTLASLILLLVLHLYGMEHDLYLLVPYYDIILHVLGGICLAASAYFVLKSPKYIVPITVVLGIVWEIFELIYDITGYSFGAKLYWVDTIKDIINDTLGAIIVWIIIKKSK